MSTGRFSVDPWDPSYGTSLDGADADDSEGEVDPASELPPDRWRGLDPDPSLPPPTVVLFVDGVRRIDAQIWVHGRSDPGSDTGDDPAAEDSAEPALCASYAAGVVRCAAEGAEPVAEIVERSLFGMADASGALRPDIVTAAGVYTAREVGGSRHLAPGQALSLGLQTRLAEIEVLAAAAARDGATEADDLLVVDGPLHRRADQPRTLGYVKTHRTAYLRTVGLNGHVGRLGIGQRTPVFRLGGQWPRFTWYLRLPTAPGSPWAGVVRLECSASVPAAEAVATARLSQVTLPRYASHGHKDSRAPQNLYPIAGLERLLRRHLGDRGLMYRALRRAAL